MEPIVLFFVLMAAPSATDDHVMNYPIPLGIYDEAEECSDAARWINEHSQNLPRHLWCMPVGITVNITGGASSLPLHRDGEVAPKVQTASALAILPLP